MRQIIAMSLMLACSALVWAEHPMTQQAMEQIVKAMAFESKGDQGYIQLSYRQVKMALISDKEHDRMRIIAPIAEYQSLSASQIAAAMESNFHKALDARYAVSQGVLYAAYIHPMSSLSTAELESALQQVASLAISFGDEYSSGLLEFGGSNKHKI